MKTAPYGFVELILPPYFGFILCFICPEEKGQEDFFKQLYPPQRQNLRKGRCKPKTRIVR